MTPKRVTVANNHNGFEFLQLWRSIDSDLYGDDAIVDLGEGDKVIASIESGPQTAVAAPSYFPAQNSAHVACR
jgi:hypothetical protein